MVTPFDAIHLRLSDTDLEALENGETIVVTHAGDSETSVVVDAAQRVEEGMGR